MGILYTQSHIKYMGNLQVFNHYNVEAFTYHILLELCVIYDTMDVMTYFTFMVICYMYGMVYVEYMYVHITFKCVSYIRNICLSPWMDGT